MRNRLLPPLGAVIAFMVSAVCAEARGLTVLHDFAGPPGDGSYPYNNVSIDAAGDILGTANLGGGTNSGIIFRIAPDGSETVLHSFDGAKGGSDPNAGVTIDPATGDLYGTTTFGGKAYCRNGCGVLYRLAANGKYSVLRSFDVGKFGFWPAGQLLRDDHGNLFGVATAGGPAENGTVFEYSARGKFKVLHTFADTDGTEPQGNLIADKAGNLYGVTNSGGTKETGTVFKLTQKGTLTTLYNFTGGADGGYPTGGLALDSAGNLYGATNLAGNGTTPFGTVFRLAPDGTLTTLYTFTGGNDGGYPAGNVLLHGKKIYGTTTEGGKGQNGVVYAVDPASGTETIVHSFTGTDGAVPQAGLTGNHGTLYGTASGGGTEDLGVVFSLK
ncbi:MAG TPA: choice-of-anchor tandem repeat GloVer-containing protein [Rhizomicrobium sp.]|jgi:uncharacterized repeat protein (TIGR03803 family)